MHGALEEIRRYGSEGDVQPWLRMAHVFAHYVDLHRPHQHGLCSCRLWQGRFMVGMGSSGGLRGGRVEREREREREREKERERERERKRERERERERAVKTDLTFNLTYVKFKRFNMLHTK